MKHLPKTQPICGPDGQPLAGSIAEASYLILGGLPQWVMIRGESITNPVMILLHGGPGFSDTPFLRRFNAPLEKDFTLVHWDQRGTGKSYDRHIPLSSMSIEQFMADLDELVETVRAKLGARQVAVFGHSWGSVLGVLYAARFPDKVAAYVGSGQYGDWAASEAASYAIALTQAQARKNRKALKELVELGPPPHDAKGMFRERTWIQRLDGQVGPRGLWKMARLILGAPESSIFDLPSIMLGWRFSIDAMWNEVSKANLLEAAPVLQMPVFLFLGRRDHWVPPETSVAYFDMLSAPSKQLVWFEESGHEPFADEPDKFNALMVSLVRPAVFSGARPANGPEPGYNTPSRAT